MASGGMMLDDESVGRFRLTLRQGLDQVFQRNNRQESRPPQRILCQFALRRQPGIESDAEGLARFPIHNR